MMKTLAQLEPRTPISSAPFTITDPGSYYLTTNITVSSGNAITIVTNGVTLDLNGFTISSTAPGAAGTGIRLSDSLQNLTILNGFIQGGVTNNGAGVYSGNGFAYGIEYDGTGPVNCRLTGVSVAGCLYNGIDLGTGDSTLVESCTARTIGGNGIQASIVKNCSAMDCGSTAIAGFEVSDCRGSGASTGVSGENVHNCSGASTAGYGVYASTALNCSGTSSSGIGLYANESAETCKGVSSGSSDGLYSFGNAVYCTGYSVSGNGVHAERSALSCYGYSNSGVGVWANVVQNCDGYSNQGTGIVAYHVAQDSCGISGGNNGVGLSAFMAQNCFGKAISDTASRGLVTTASAIGCCGLGKQFAVLVDESQNSGIAIGCYGYSYGGTAVKAHIANSCGVGAGALNVDFKYNMP
jgi:hypothetical protein